MYKDKRKKATTEMVFILTSLTCYFITLLRLLYTNGECFNELFDQAGYFSFCDYLMHLSFVSTPSGVYIANAQACFPPFAYLFYYFIVRILPSPLEPTMNGYRALPGTLLIYMVLLCVCIGILYYQISTLLKDTPSFVLPIFLLLLFSEPLWGGFIERGNSVGFAVILVLQALIWKDSEKAVQKELALFFIAFAAGLKIYPAVVGLLYIFEKRWKEVFRLIIYGLFIFFIPFLFFGGFQGMLQFFRNLVQITDATGSLCTIRGFFYLIYQKLTASNFIPPSIQIIGTAIMLFFLLFSIYMSWISSKYWIRLLFLCCLMIVFVPSSYPYTTVYLMIPFLFFLRESNTLAIDYAVIWGFIFTIFALPLKFFTDFSSYSFAFGLRYPALFLLLLFAASDTIKARIQNIQAQY